MLTPERIFGQAFGPGFAGTGSRVEVELSGYGMRLVTAEAPDGAPGWSEITVRKGGFNDSRLMVEWTGVAGRYALAVADAPDVAVLRAHLREHAPKSAGPAGSGRMGVDGATRAWSHGIFWVTIVLPMLLLGAIIWEHDRIAGWIVSLAPVAQERKLGEIVFNHTRAKLKLVDGPPAMMVREIGARLTAGSAYQYEFHVAEDATVNAFAMPGGFVVVHTGLLALASSAEEVAGVLAHEVQHVELRHSLKGMAKSAGLAVMVSLVFGDLGGIASMGADLIGLKFSRAHESEADAQGLAALVKAGIAPAGMRDFFRKMGEQEKLNLGWLSSHPASEDRFAALDRAIKALPPAALAAKPLAYDYAAIKAALPATKAPAPKPSVPDTEKK